MKTPKFLAESASESGTPTKQYFRLVTDKTFSNLNQGKTRVSPMAAATGDLQGSEGGEVMQFNLTDPDRLCDQLEQADLDDEETDLVLQEALKLNAHLKDVLRSQQMEGRESSGKSRTRKSVPSHPLAAPLHAPRNPRQSTLPPIRRETRSAKSKGMAESQRETGGSASRRKTQAKPTWDDRFGYN